MMLDISDPNYYDRLDAQKEQLRLDIADRLMQMQVHRQRREYTLADIIKHQLELEGVIIQILPTRISFLMPGSAAPLYFIKT